MDTSSSLEMYDVATMHSPSSRSSSRRCNGASADSSYAKLSNRTYVQHNYQDHYNDPIFRSDMGNESAAEGSKRRGPRGGVVIPFPDRLYNMLSEAEFEGFEDVVSWQPHGRCFIVHEPKRFVEEVMPKYFRQSKLTSFQRQVNLYGFRRLTAGPDRGGYYHEMFLRGRPDLNKKLIRVRVKGTGFKAAGSPSTEPNFYAFEHCLMAGPKKTLEKAEKEHQSDFDEDMITPSLPLSITPSSDVIVTPPASPRKSPSFPSLKLAKPLSVTRSSEMNLKSMAQYVAGDTFSPGPAQPEEQHLVTPDCTVRQLVSSELQEALNMTVISPDDSNNQSRFASTSSLDEYSEKLVPSLLTAPLLDGIQDYPIEDTSFESDVRALLGNDLQPEFYSLDPLFLLDDFHSN